MVCSDSRGPEEGLVLQRWCVIEEQMCGDKCSGGVLLWDAEAVITRRAAHLQDSRWKTASELVSITEL